MMGSDCVKQPSGCAPCEKIVSVVEKDGSATAALRRIFRLCGRENCRVAERGAPVPLRAGKAVLLVCGDCGAVDASKWPVCVAERDLSDRITGSRRMITYSLGRDDADFTARNVRRMPGGRVTFEIVGIGVIGRVRLADGDPASVGGALAAAAAAVGAGIPFAEVLSALSGEGPAAPEAESPGRPCIIPAGSLQNKGGSSV